MAKRHDFSYFFHEGLSNMFSHGFMSFAAVCMIVACLLIMGSFSLLAVNLDHMLGDLEAENEMLAYIDENYTEEQARSIQPEIETLPNVTKVTFVSREEALEDYKEGRENNPLLDDLPDEVLRDRFRIHVENLEQMEQTEAAVEQVTGVANVRAAIDIANGFVLARNIATGVAVVLIGILLVVSLFIISNTVKVTIFSSRRSVMEPGETVYLTSKIEGFDGYETMYQWQCDKGNGFEDIAGANDATYAFGADVDTLSYDWKLLVYYR